MTRSSARWTRSERSRPATACAARDSASDTTGGDAVSSEYKPKFELSGGTVLKVVYDIADDAYFDVEQHLAAAIARD